LALIRSRYLTGLQGISTTDGGPQNAMLFCVLYLCRNAFQHLNMGYAAALARVLFFIIMGLTAFIFRRIGRLVY
jgi:multiple sugar transport system permease protein